MLFDLQYDLKRAEETLATNQRFLTNAETALSEKEAELRIADRDLQADPNDQAKQQTKADAETAKTEAEQRYDAAQAGVEQAQQEKDAAQVAFDEAKAEEDKKAAKASRNGWIKLAVATVLFILLGLQAFTGLFVSVGTSAPAAAGLVMDSTMVDSLGLVTEDDLTAALAPLSEKDTELERAMEGALDETKVGEMITSATENMVEDGDITNVVRDDGLRAQLGNYVPRDTRNPVLRQNDLAAAEDAMTAAWERVSGELEATKVAEIAELAKAKVMGDLDSYFDTKKKDFDDSMAAAKTATLEAVASGKTLAVKAVTDRGNEVADELDDELVRLSGYLTEATTSLDKANGRVDELETAILTLSELVEISDEVINSKVADLRTIDALKAQMAELRVELEEARAAAAEYLKFKAEREARRLTDMPPASDP